MRNAVKRTVISVLLLCTAIAFACFSACSVGNQSGNSTDTPKHTHTYVETVSSKYLKSAATCTQKAIYYKSCSCGEKSTTTFEYGTALGHSYTNYESDNNATCVNNATETATCDRGCGTSDTRTVENSALGHDFTEWTSNENGTHTRTCNNENCSYYETKDCHGGTATCTEQATCEDCNAKYGEALGHSYTNYESNNDETCESNGTETATCDHGCGTSDTKTIENSALGHDYGEWESNGDGTHTKTCAHDSTHTVTESCNGGTATCTKKAICSDCGEEYGQLLPHNYSSEWTKTKTHHYHECACGAKTDEAEHTPSAEPTETTAQTCTVCGYVIQPELGHVHTLHLTKVEAKAASCTEAGNIEYYTCSCEKLFSDSTALTEITDKNSVIIAKESHSYTQLKHNATAHWYECVCGAKNGEEAHKGGTATCTKLAECSECGEKYGELKSHTFNSQNTDEKYLKTAATCTEKAVYYYSCSCGEKGTETFEYGTALGHSYTNYVSDNNATCEKDGTETATCDRGCGTTDTKTEEGSAIGHKYGAPTYVWNGDKCIATRICLNDNNHKESETATAIYVKDTEATCTTAEKGHYEATFKNSAFATQVTEKDSVVNGTALGHDWQESETIIYCTIRKYQKYKCSRCSEEKEEFVNVYVTGDNIPDGHKSLSVGGTCEHCGGEVLVKNGDSLVIKSGDIYQVEHYSGTAVCFSDYASLINSAYISNEVTTIGGNAFKNYTALTSVTIPNSITSIGQYAFKGCSLLTEIKYYAAECADLSSYNYAFYNAGKDRTGIKVTIGKNVKKIPARLFQYTNLNATVSPEITEVVFEEDSVCESIGKYAFYDCSSLTSIDIPSGVTSIGDSAFV